MRHRVNPGGSCIQAFAAFPAVTFNSCPLIKDQPSSSHHQSIQQRKSLTLVFYHPPLTITSTVSVVTTTTTTTTYAPNPLPILPTPPAPHDPQKYPLLSAQLPPSFRQFPLVFPNGSRATFHDSDDTDDLSQEEEFIGGKGCHLVWCRPLQVRWPY